MGAQSAPGHLQGVENLVLGDGLVDAPHEDLLGSAAVELDGFVGGEERDAGFLQLAFDGEPFEHAPGGSGDAFTDDDVESPGGACCFGQEVGDAAVAGDGDVEALVSALTAACRQLHPAGLDVIEVADDRPGFGQCALAVTELPDERLPWILLLLGRGPAHPRDPYLAAEQGGGHAEGGYGEVRKGRGRRTGGRGESAIQNGGGRIAGVIGEVVDGHAAVSS
nr:hypothetical protein [Actinacidiphila epipremni]